MSRPAPLHACALFGALAFLTGAPAGTDPTDNAADDTTAAGAFDLAPPVRLKAGDAWLGGKQMYPSPALHDVDGDGRADVVIGDLFGKVTVAPRAKDGTLAAQVAIERRDGEPLAFSNW